ncbi:MAG: VIT1/CCC1 transporter family protein [Candidatus Ranarchaeia archaeon]
MVRNKLREISRLLKLSEVTEIARRYFVMNAFDGCMTTLGLIAGLFIKGVLDPSVIIIGGIGTTIAMGMSGGFGAYMTEQAEQHKKLQEIEAAMMTDLNNTELSRAEKVGSYFVSAVDAFSPVLPSLMMLLPFVLVQAGLLIMAQAYIVSFSIVIGTLFILGVYLSRISGQPILNNSIKMLIAGALTAVIIIFLGAA